MSDEIPKRRRHGPTPLPADELRRHSVSCRLTDAELSTVDERRGEVSRGEWLRLAALSKPPRIVPTVNKVAWADLSRSAGNLNQITRAINEGRLPVSDRAKVGAQLMQIRAEMDQLRRLLVGQEVSDEGQG